MRLLLDSHTFLCFVEGSPRLSVKVRSLIEDADNDVFLSITSVWELSIKVSKGVLTFNTPFDEFIPSQIAGNDFELLPVALPHAIRVAALPRFDDHKDPFDRMLIAQAQSEAMSLLSYDTVFDRYAVSRIW